MYKLTLN